MELNFSLLNQKMSRSLSWVDEADAELRRECNPVAAIPPCVAADKLFGRMQVKECDGRMQDQDSNEASMWQIVGNANTASHRGLDKCQKSLATGSADCDSGMQPMVMGVVEGQEMEDLKLANGDLAMLGNPAEDTNSVGLQMPKLKAQDSPPADSLQSSIAAHLEIEPGTPIHQQMQKRGFPWPQFDDEPGKEQASRLDNNQLRILVHYMKKEIAIETGPISLRNQILQDLQNSPASKALSKVIIQSSKLLLDMAIDQPNFSESEEENELGQDNLDIIGGQGSILEDNEMDLDILSGKKDEQEGIMILHHQEVKDHFQVVMDRIRALKTNGGPSTHSNTDGKG